MLLKRQVYTTFRCYTVILGLPARDYLKQYGIWWSYGQCVSLDVRALISHFLQYLHIVHFMFEVTGLHTNFVRDRLFVIPLNWRMIVDNIVEKNIVDMLFVAMRY